MKDNQSNKDSKDVKKNGSRSGKGRSNRGRSNNRSRNNYNDSKSYNKNGKAEEIKEPHNINDSTYYYNDPTVLQQITNFSFNQFQGMEVEFPVTINGKIPKALVENICAIHLNPCIPARQAAGPAAGITNAAMRNYLVLSSTNNKSTIYAPQDVMILQLAICELIKVEEWCKRAIGVSYLFSYRNRDYPDKLLKAMGIDGSDMRAHLAAYRVTFNTLINVANGITFPANVPCFKKAFELYRNIYTDSDNSAMAQTYILNPNSTWIFDEAYDTQGSGLRTTLFVGTNITQPFSYYLTIFENMINALLNSTTLNAIYSDIMRLAMKNEMSEFIKFTSVEDNYVCPIGYNPEIELWLHNATMLSFPLSSAQQYGSGYTPDNDVSCDVNDNAIIYNPQFFSATEMGKSLLLDFLTDQVNDEMKVAATRLSARWTVVKDSSGNYFTDKVAFMDEYVVDLCFFTGTTYHNIGLSLINVSAQTPQFVATITDIISKFDWAPFLYWIDPTEPSDILTGITGDTNYYTLVDYELLKRMYDYEVLHFYQIG